MAVSTWPISASSGANLTLSNLTDPTAFNRDFTFDNNNRTLKLPDINASGGSAKVLRIQGQDNTNTGAGAPAGDVRIMSGGSANGHAPNVYLGNHYPGPDVVGPGDYIFMSLGEMDGGPLVVRIYNPDSAVAPNQPGVEFWQFAVANGTYHFGTDAEHDMFCAGAAYHGPGVPCFPKLTVFDGTPAAVFNGDVANATLDSYLGSQGGTGVQPFLGAYVGALGIGYASGDSRTSISAGTITKKSGTGVLSIIADGVAIPTHTPSSAGDTGTAGQIAWDASYVYVCTATNTWKRVAIATW